MLGLRFCARAFSSCGEWGPLFIAVCRPLHYHGLSCCRAQAPDAQAQWLWLTGPVAPRHVGSSQTRARTCVPCIGRQILNHCATREAPHIYFCIFTYLFILNFSFLFFFFYLFLAALGLHCCAQAFSSCGAWGLLFVAVHRFLIAVASLVAEHRL